MVQPGSIVAGIFIVLLIGGLVALGILYWKQRQDNDKLQAQIKQPPKKPL